MSTRTLGPLSRGHDPVALVQGVFREEMPAGFVVSVVLEGDRAVVRAGRDEWEGRADITLQVIEAGGLRDCARYFRARWEAWQDGGDWS